MFANKNAAMRSVMKKIVKKCKCSYTLVDANFERHFLLKSTKASCPKWYGMFKRGYFMSFNEFFPEFVRKHGGGVAESINKECLQYALSRGVDWLVWIHDDEKVYVSQVKMVAKYCMKHGLVRTQKGGEETFCVPVHILVNIDDVLP